MILYAAELNKCLDCHNIGVLWSGHNRKTHMEADPSLGSCKPYICLYAGDRHVQVIGELFPTNVGWAFI